ncbi:hypothetical protein GCM10010233_59420 [Streptomyces pseudogriseolus]|uniref:Uncharacterized protein n=1 Tax=Streptomyces pseudogriseolus TaxID=36817 RepID=A0ABQ2TIT9_STREZ|nr:hypothetical protein GCM10010233_59420 [Streptomyces gancidicus]GGS70319.1 hypothetical protein GCM10010285_56520 [Streptomyces rubiginosus]
MSRTSKCRLARAWASWVAWSAMNKPLEPALKGMDPVGARGQLFLDQRGSGPRVTGWGAAAYAYAPGGDRGGRDRPQLGTFLHREGAGPDADPVPASTGDARPIDWCVARTVPAREALRTP